MTNSGSGRLRFSNKRVECPNCGAKHGFAQVEGDAFAGKCHACGAFIPPSSNPTDRDSGILRTRTGGAIDVNAPSRIHPREILSNDREVPVKDVSQSRRYLVRSSAEGIERAGISQYDGGLTLEASECEAASSLGLTSLNADTSLKRLVIEDTLLRRESAFAARMSELTGMPSIMADWYVGLSHGAVLFWYLDQNGRFRNAKKIWFGADGFHRLRDDKHPPYFLYTRQNGFSVPLYGEWQLTPRERRPFALFESEKTAIIASGYLRKYVCLAVGGHELTDERKAQVLRGRTGIILFDREDHTMRAADRAADTLRKIGAKAVVEDLERIYPGIPKNWDLADVILNQYHEWQQTMQQ